MQTLDKDLRVKYDYIITVFHLSIISCIKIAQ